MTTTFLGAATGTIQVAGDSDWFGITLQAGTEYVFNLGNSTLSDPEVSIYNASGSLVSSASGGGAGGPSGENTQIAFTPTTTGTYYVGASSTSGQQTGKFALIASSATYDFAGNVNTTGTVAIGGSATGNLTVAGQNDWFKVTLTAGQEYSFNVSSGSLASTSNQLVTLYNSAGQYIQSGTDFEQTSGGQVTYVATTSGTYFVGVSGSSAATGSFTLTASNPIVTVGDTVATAGTVTVGGTVSGTIAMVQQRDWYGVALTAGTQYVFSVSGGTLGSNASVAVYDANGNAVVSQISGGTANGAERAFTPTTSGTYYAEAGGILGTTGTFTVGVTTAADPYISTINTAGTLTAGGAVSSSITVPGESNWFKVSLAANTEYVFKVAGSSLSAPAVTLYNAAGVQISQVQSSGSNPAQLTFEAPSAGTYFVGASGFLANLGSYTISESTATPDVLGNINTLSVLAVGGKTSGSLTTAGQNDWFKVTLTAGKEYVFDINGALSGGQVTLYNSSGTELVTGGNETSFAPTTTGTYFVAASSASEATGSYTLSAATYTGSFAAGISTTGVFDSAAQEVANYQAGTLTVANAISDSVANIQANIDGLQTVNAAGLLKSITLTDDQIDSTPVLTLTAAQFDTDYPVLSKINGSYTLNITGYSANAVAFIQNAQNQGVRYIPGTTHAGSNQVIEISSIAAGASAVSLGSGFNAVIIDGTHSTTAAGAGSPDSFSFNVAENGTVTLHDNNTGASESITGASYLIFNDAATNPDGSYQSIYYVESNTNAEIASLYQAAFLRQPDLHGLEYYAAPIAAGTLSLHQTAANFLASPEFLTDYPAAAAPPDNGGPNDQAYIKTLYANVLGRTPSAFELNYYVNDLTSGTFDRAQLLINFAISTENQAKIAGFLVNTNNGAYADPGNLLSATTVLSEVTAGGTLNSASIDPTSINGSLTANGITISPLTLGTAGSITLSSAAPAESVDLSANFANAVINSNGNSIYDSTANSVITVNGANNQLFLIHGGIDVINLLGGTNTTVVAFSPGSGSSLNVANTNNPAAVQILDGSTTQVSGLNFSNGTNYVINVGNVGAGTAATVATAANAAYSVADVAGEHLTFMGLNSSGNTVFYFFGSTAGASNGIIPASSLTASADTNLNHTVVASELTLVATVVGVAPTAFSTTDLG
jgi:hypothetical protein